MTAIGTLITMWEMPIVCGQDVSGSAPQITQQPVSVAVQQGSDSSFEVTAVGSKPLSYRWFFNEQVIRDESSSTLAAENVSIVQVGTYQVEVRNAFGSVKSDLVELWLEGRPVVDSQPETIEIQSGDKLEIVLNVLGEEPFETRWYQDGLPLLAPEATTFLRETTQFSDEGIYHAVFRNQFGETSTNPITVKVQSAPEILILPHSLPRTADDIVVLGTSVQGSSPIEFVWRDANGNTVSNDELFFLREDHPSGIYTIDVSNSLGTTSGTVEVHDVLPQVPSADWSMVMPLELSDFVDTALAVDSDGASVWVINITNESQSTRIGTMEYRTRGASDPIIIKIDATGSISWVLHEGDGGDETIDDVATGVGNEIFVAGHISGTSVFREITHRGQYYKPFVAKYSAEGALDWALELPCTGVRVPIRVLPNPDGGVYVVSNAIPVSSSRENKDRRESLDFYGFDEDSHGGGFAMKFDAAGELEWTLPVNGSNSFRNKENAAVDAAGNLSFAMQISGNITAGSTQIPFEIGQEQYADLLLHLSSEGQLDWNLMPVSTLPLIIRGLESDVLGNVYLNTLSAGTLGSVWIRNGTRSRPYDRFSPQMIALSASGHPLFTSNTQRRIKDIDSFGNVYSATRWYNGGNNPDYTPQFQEEWTVFINKTTPNGQRFWTSTIATDRARGESIFYDAELDIDGNLHAIGAFGGPTRFLGGPEIISERKVVYLARLQPRSNGVGPRITQQPANSQWKPGDQAIIEVIVDEENQAEYQWFRNGIALPDARNAKLTIESVDLNDEGNYNVQEAKNGEFVVSDPATLTVQTPPRIITRSPDLLLLEGAQVRLEVELEGSQPMTFTWLKDGAAIAGETDSRLDLIADSGRSAGHYQLRVENPFGSATSEPIELKLLAPPLLTQQPESRTIRKGERLELSGLVSSLGELDIQWFRDGNAIANASELVLTIENVQFVDEGSYTVRISNQAGTTISREAIVTVLGDPPSLVEEPPNQLEVLQGDPIFFSIEATGDRPLSYRWTRDDVEEPISIARSFSIPFAQFEDSGSYRVEISNRFGSIISRNSVIVVKPRIPTPPMVEVLGIIESTQSVAVNSLAVSDFGDVWIVGQVQGEARLGGDQILSTSGPSGFIANLLGTGDLQSATVVSSGRFAEVHDISPRRDGSVNIGGLFFEDATIGSQHVAAEGVGVLLAGLSKAGETIWITDIGVSRIPAEDLQVVSTMKDLVAVVPLSADSTASFDRENEPISLDPVSQPSLLILGANHESGKIQWFHQLTSSGTISVAALERDDQGGVYLAGAFSETMVVGAETHESLGEDDAFLLHLDSTGEIVTAITWGGEDTERVTGLSLTGGGDLYVSGEWSAEFTFGEFALKTNPNQGPPLLRIGANGTIQHLIPTTAPAFGRADLFGNFTAIDTNSILLENELTREQLSIWRLDSEGRNLWELNLQGSELGLGGNGHFAMGRVFGAYWALTARQLLSAERELLPDSSNSERTVLLRFSQSGEPFAPEIRLQAPVQSSVSWGSAVEFQAEPSGIGTIQVQWLLNGSPIQGENEATLKVSRAKLSDTGDYRVLAANEFGSTLSEPVSLRVIGTPPQFSLQPNDVSASLNESVTFSAEVDDGPRAAFQWTLNGEAIEGAIGPSFTIEFATEENEGLYRVVATNAIGATRSQAARLTFQLRNPKIITQPIDATVEAGDRVTLFVAAEGDGELRYQWFRNGELLESQTEWFIRLNDAVPENAGDYQVEVTSLGGSTMSLSASLVVTSPPTIVTLPAEKQLVALGSAKTLEATISGHQDVMLQWDLNGVRLEGAIENTFTISSAALVHEGTYRLVATSPNGSVSEASTILNVVEPPKIQGSPDEPYQYVDRPFILRSQFEIKEGVAYQWYRNDEPIANAVSPVLPIIDPTENDSGSYYLIAAVDDLNLSAQNLSLQVLGPPQILGAPSDTRIETGQPFLAQISLSVPEDSSKITWFKDGVPLQTETGIALAWDSLETSDSGTYSAEISNPAGTTQFSGFRLDVTIDTKLRLAFSGGLLVLIWADSGSEFVLEETDSLDDLTPWKPSTSTPVQVGSDFTLPISPSPGAVFFRLRYPLLEAE